MSSNWVTDEEFTEIDDIPDVFPDVDADNEDQPQEHEPAGTPLPYLDPEVAEEFLKQIKQMRGMGYVFGLTG